MRPSEQSSKHALGLDTTSPHQLDSWMTQQGASLYPLTLAPSHICRSSPRPSGEGEWVMELMVRRQQEDLKLSLCYSPFSTPTITDLNPYHFSSTASKFCRLSQRALAALRAFQLSFLLQAWIVEDKEDSRRLALINSDDVAMSLFTARPDHSIIMTPQYFRARAQFLLESLSRSAATLWVIRSSASPTNASMSMVTLSPPKQTQQRATARRCTTR